MRKLLILTVFLVTTSTPLYAADKLNVVATQALFADLVREVGRERVEVYAVASPKFNIHFIQPRPSDVRKVAKADLYVNAGLDLEAWSDPLLEAAGQPELFRGGARNVDLSEGVPLLKIPSGQLSRSGGDLHLFGNPHYHMDPGNVRQMVTTLAGRLKEVDPAGAEFYDRNESEFLARLEAKLAEWKGLCAHCAGREILSYHDDIEYLAHFLGLNVHMFLEPKPGIPPTAKHLAAIEADAREHDVRVIVQPTYYPKDTSQHVAEKIGGKVVFICQNAGELPGTESFFGLFDTNVKAISEALR